MVISGGGSVAVEMAHLFSSLGGRISTLWSLPRHCWRHSMPISLGGSPRRPPHGGTFTWRRSPEVRNDGNGVGLVLEDGDVNRRRRCCWWRPAVRRIPTIWVWTQLGIALRPDGHIAVDEFGRAATGIWALGDCSSPFELKHVANAEARTIAHNLAHADDLRPLPHHWVPAAVFTDPQIAWVGARSQDLAGRPYVEALQEYSDVAYGWALQDHTGVCKLYADPETGRLLGAHILGYQASLLITPLVQAVAHGQRVADLARASTGYILP